MNLTQILGVLNNVLPVIGALSPGQAKDVVTKAQALVGILLGLKPVNSVDSAVSDLQSAIKAVSASGAVTDPNVANILAEVTSVIDKYTTAKANFESGQAVPLVAHVKVDGRDTAIVALEYGGPAASALGL